MESKNKPKSFSLAERHIYYLDRYDGNQSALTQSLFDKHIEEENKSYEHKLLETQLIGLDIAIKNTFKEYMCSLEVNDNNILFEPEYAVNLREQMKYLQRTFATTCDVLTTNYVNVDAMNMFLQSNNIGFTIGDFWHEGINNKYHENDWAVLKYIHCVVKYMSSKRYFTQGTEEDKHFVVIFLNCDLQLQLLTNDSDESIDYIKAWKRYIEHVHY